MESKRKKKHLMHPYCTNMLGSRRGTSDMDTWKCLEVRCVLDSFLLFLLFCAQFEEEIHSETREIRRHDFPKIRPPSLSAAVVALYKVRLRCHRL